MGNWRGGSERGWVRVGEGLEKAWPSTLQEHNLQNLISVP